MMEKMDFKKTIVQRIWFIRIVYVAALVLILNYCFGNFLTIPEPETQYLSDFQTGLLVGIEIVLLFLYSKYRKAVFSEKELQALYNSEHDERKILIKQKAGFPAIWISSVIMLFGAVIAGYFNSTVFYALSAAAVMQLVFCCALKLVYSRKFTA